MDSGFYAACTGLMAKTQALDLAANNIANTGTVGYKSQTAFYQSLTASLNGRPLSALDQAVNDYGVLGGAAVNLSHGEFSKTGNDLDLALEGSGFFVVQTAGGDRYTRNGSFQVNAAGRLVTATGGLVMADNGPIDLPSGTISISSDGTISHQGAVVAHLKVVNFAKSTPLTPEGNSLYQAPVGSEQPAADPQIAQGTLEGANQSPMAGAMSLVTLQRTAQLLEQALTIFHSTFNSEAAQELPRVS